MLILRIFIADSSFPVWYCKNPATVEIQIVEMGKRVKSKEVRENKVQYFTLVPFSPFSLYPLSPLCSLSPSHRRESAYPVAILQYFIPLGMNPVQEDNPGGLGGDVHPNEEFPDPGPLLNFHDTRIPGAFVG